MKNINRKTALSLILAASLSLTSCAKTESNQKRYEENIRDLIESYEEYNYEGNNYYKKETLDAFFKNYIKNYGKFLNEEQYSTIISLMQINYSGSDPFPYETTQALLNEIVSSDKNQFGRGLGRAFNLRLIYENIFPSWILDDEVYEEFNTLRSVVNNDDEFYSCLFSSDREGLIECIQNNTGMKEEKIRELILLFDSYSDIRKSEEYGDIELKDTYTKSIKELMSELVKSKLKTDEKFANTLLGQLLSKSEYNGDYKYGVTNYLFNDIASINGFKDTNMYCFSIPSYNLRLNKTISEIKSEAVCDIIKNGDNEDNSYEYDAMKLMIHLIDPNTLTKSNLTKEEIHRILYDNLKDEFKTIEDFDDFFLLIANGSSMIYYDYFILFEKRLKMDGITYEDFVRFTSLANFMHENEDITIDWNWDMEYPPYDEIKRMKEEEYNDVVRSFSSNWLFDGMDYKMCMGMSYDLIKDNDLGYEQLYSPNCEYAYESGKVYVSSPSSLVVSGEVKPKEGFFFGNNVIYYEVPENYETGRAVECFYNIERKLTVIDVPGIFKTVYDPEKGHDITIFILDVNGKLDEDTPSVCFMEYYDYYQEKVDNKKLSLEAK